LAPCARTSAQASCDHEPARSIVIGSAIGAAFIVGGAFSSDQDHRIAANERLPYLWGAAWGVAIGSSVGSIVARQRCPRRARIALPAADRSCGRAAALGAGKGALSGGYAAFLIAPILLLGPAAISGGKFNFDRAIGITTTVGAGVGAPAGALHEYRDCRNPSS
jgi:hypothetical protein